MNEPTNPAPQTPTAPPQVPAPASVPPPQPPPLEPAMPENPDLKTLFESLLRRPHALIPRLGSPGVSRRFAGLAAVSLLLFGLVLGCFAKHEQLWAAPVKITAGLLIAGVICFPSLYIFSTLAGARVTMAQLASALAGALALAGLLLLGFAPAVWIFAESTDSFGFMGFLAIGAWLIAMIFALRFLKTVVFATGGNQFGPIVVWSIVFLLVTLQMTTSLRPILGRSPDFLTQEKKFFLQHWGETMDRSLNSPPPAQTRKTVRGTDPLPEANSTPAPNPDTRQNPYKN
ncbi:MAG: hypothetical protein J0M04_17150 [Verrucomicrobia bacterium]|nr:hypothetical protein [Verrucomicrobiota bacterium]